MKKLLAIGLACSIPMGLAAEDPNAIEALLGTVDVLVIDDAAAGTHAMCARAGKATECMSFNRAVLTAHIQKASMLKERGRWM